jgi:peptidoglycan/LPS O-acetylase OafA/YrhL
MLGILRFALALSVAFSHMGLTPNFHFGAMAVMGFYLIAGYVMTYSFEHNFGNTLANTWRFYVDRFFRIYPLYILSLLLILAFTAVTHYGKLYLDARSWVVNLTVFWLNAHPTPMNPATWSLGTESQFYLLLPLLVVFPRLKYSLILPSYAIYALASFGYLGAFNWGYKLMPGTLFFFILGSVIFDMRMDATNKSRNIVLSICGLAVCHLIVLSFFPSLMDQPYAFETLVGLLGCTVWLWALADVKPVHKGLDVWLGKLSYPLFLCHVPVLFAFDHLRIQGIFTPSPRGMVALQIIVAIALSIPMAMVDDRVQAYRKKIQRKPMAPGDPIPAVPSAEIAH